MHTAKEVGGDFYDFYFIDDDNLAFLMADVSGKGIPAAMFMMQSKTIIKSCAESGMSIEQVLTVANEKLCEGNDAGMFVTAWMCILNVKTGKIFYANAGHCLPLVKHADGTYEYLKTRTGLVLAGMEGVRYRKYEVDLAPGDAIYLYTDGVTEATDANNTLYGDDRLHSILEKYKDAAPHVICDEVKRDVDAFVGEAPQFDDITMLSLKYNGEGDA
jgi:sigma-B regulation protein RsbU (phosphoserine phosphatase)